jgi:hypothetical protein
METGPLTLIPAHRVSSGGSTLSSESNFVQQQGYAEADPAACGVKLPALMFQPRIIGALVAVGLLTQSPFLFLAIGALLAWSALLPMLNPFEALYTALVARSRGQRIDPAPPPRRFAQGMAAGFMFGIALALLGGHATLARILEAMLVAALLALIFGRFCLGSYLYHVVTGRLAFANRTLPWRRDSA